MSLNREASMTRNRAAAALAIALAPGFFGQESSESRLPTFHRDVAPLVLEKCASCHRPEGFHYSPADDSFEEDYLRENAVPL